MVDVYSEGEVEGEGDDGDGKVCARRAKSLLVGGCVIRWETSAGRSMNGRNIESGRGVNETG